MYHLVYAARLAMTNTAKRDDVKLMPPAIAFVVMIVMGGISAIGTRQFSRGWNLPALNSLVYSINGTKHVTIFAAFLAIVFSPVLPIIVWRRAFAAHGIPIPSSGYFALNLTLALFAGWIISAALMLAFIKRAKGFSSLALSTSLEDTHDVSLRIRLTVPRLFTQRGVFVCPNYTTIKQTEVTA